MFLVTGLGNPGTRYEGTRHNIGLEALASIATKLDPKLCWTTKSNANLGQTKLADSSLLLLSPLVYMNESGRAIGPIYSFYKLKPTQLIVLHDELDLAPGVVRIKQGGGTGGHRGLDSIAQSIGSKDFFRIRIGIGHPREIAEESTEVSDWVLARPSNQQQKLLEDGVSLGVRALELLVISGLAEAQREIHSLC